MKNGSDIGCVPGPGPALGWKAVEGDPLTNFNDDIKSNCVAFRFFVRVSQSKQPGHRPPFFFIYLFFFSPPLIFDLNLFTQGHPKRLQEHGGPVQGHGEERPVCPLGRQREEVTHAAPSSPDLGCRVAPSSSPDFFLSALPVTFSTPCFLSTTSPGRRLFSKVSGVSSRARGAWTRDTNFCLPLTTLLFVLVCFRGRGRQLLRCRPGRDGCKRRLFKIPENNLRVCLWNTQPVLTKPTKQQRSSVRQNITVSQSDSCSCRLSGFKMHSKAVKSFIFSTFYMRDSHWRHQIYEQNVWNYVAKYNCKIAQDIFFFVWRLAILKDLTI